MTTQVQEKDSKAVKVEGDQEQTQQPQPYDEAKLKEKIQNDPEFYKDFLENQENYVVVAEAQPPDIPPPAEDGVVPEPEKKEEKKEDGDDSITATIPKSALGNANDVAEFLKSVEEKDKIISALRRQRIPALEQERDSVKTDMGKEIEAEKTKRSDIEKERDALNKQIEDLQKAAQAPAPKEEKPKENVEEVDESLITGLFDRDIMGEEAADKGERVLKALVAQNKAGSSKLQDAVAKIEQLQQNMLETGKQTPPPAPAAEDPAVAEAAKLATQAKTDARVERELLDIETFRTAHPEIFGKEGRLVRDIEKDYLDFADKLRVRRNVTQPLFVGGHIGPDTYRLIQLYNEDTAEGRAFKAECVAAKVGLPSDFDVLDRVYAVRGIRNKYVGRDANGNNSVPISFDQALGLYEREHGAFSHVDAEQRIQEQEQRARAAENRQQHASQTPAGDRSDSADINSGENAVANAKFNELYAKPASTWTDEDRAFMLKAYKDKGIGEEEFDAFYSKRN